MTGVGSRQSEVSPSLCRKEGSSQHVPTQGKARFYLVLTTHFPDMVLNTLPWVTRLGWTGTQTLIERAQNRAGYTLGKCAVGGGEVRL